MKTIIPFDNPNQRSRMWDFQTHWGPIGIKLSEENEQIKITYLDSLGRFIGNHFLDGNPSDEEAHAYCQRILGRFQELPGLIAYAGSPAFYITTNLEDLYEKMQTLNMLYPEDKCTEEVILSNEWVNKIGPFYIIVDENRAG